MNIFNECQKFIREEGDPVDMFSFLVGDNIQRPVLQPNILIKRLVKKASLPGNHSIVSSSQPSLSRSQGKLIPISKESNLRYQKNSDLQYISTGGLSRLAVWRNKPTPKKQHEIVKKQEEEVKEEYQLPKQVHQTKKMEKFQNSLIPKKPQQSRLDTLEGPSPYDGSWANQILKGFFKVQVTKKKDQKWVVQRFTQLEEDVPLILEDETQKALRYQEALFRNTAQKVRRKESIPIILNKRLDEYVGESLIQKSNPSLQSYMSKGQKSRKAKHYNLVAQQFVQTAFEEPTFMPIFDLNFEKNYEARIYIAMQKGQLGIKFAQ